MCSCYYNLIFYSLIVGKRDSVIVDLSKFVLVKRERKKQVIVKENMKISINKKI